MPEKYQQEIEEILKRVEEATPGDHPTQPKKNSKNLSQPSRGSNHPHQSRGTGIRWLYLSPLKILLAGLILFVVGAVPLGLSVLIWVGLGLLVLGYLLLFIKPGSLSYEKRWRGRAVESRPSAWQRLTRWLKG